MTASVASTACTDTDTATLLTHAPSTTTFLWKAPPLTYDDFDPKEIELHEDDMKVIAEFEVCWKEFLQDHPGVLPTGKKGARIKSFEHKLQGLQTAKRNVEAELQRQLDFFDSAKEQLESNFERLKIDEERGQERMMAEMEGRLESAVTSARNVEANGDWELFFEALEEAVEQSEVKPLPGDGLSTLLGLAAQSPRAAGSVATKTSAAMKPSTKALFLNNATAESDMHMRSRDFLLRAFRIDNALLHAQLKVLQRDVERVEQGTKTTDFVGRFLTDHNIWGLLSSPAPQSGRNTVVGSRVSRPTASTKSPRAGRV